MLGKTKASKKAQNNLKNSNISQNYSSYKETTRKTSLTKLKKAEEVFFKITKSNILSMEERQILKEAIIQAKNYNKETTRTPLSNSQVSSQEKKIAKDFLDHFNLKITDYPFKITDVIEKDRNFWKNLIEEYKKLIENLEAKIKNLERKHYKEKKKIVEVVKDLESKLEAKSNGLRMTEDKSDSYNNNKGTFKLNHNKMLDLLKNKNSYIDELEMRKAKMKVRLMSRIVKQENVIQNLLSIGNYLELQSSRVCFEIKGKKESSLLNSKKPNHKRTKSISNKKNGRSKTQEKKSALKPRETNNLLKSLDVDDEIGSLSKNKDIKRIVDEIHNLSDIIDQNSSKIEIFKSQLPYQKDQCNSFNKSLDNMDASLNIRNRSNDSININEQIRELNTDNASLKAKLELKKEKLDNIRKVYEKNLKELEIQLVSDFKVIETKDIEARNLTDNFISKYKEVIDYKTDNTQDYVRQYQEFVDFQNSIQQPIKNHSYLNSSNHNTKNMNNTFSSNYNSVLVDESDLQLSMIKLKNKLDKNKKINKIYTKEISDKDKLIFQLEQEVLKNKIDHEIEESIEALKEEHKKEVKQLRMLISKKHHSIANKDKQIKALTEKIQLLKSTQSQLVEAKEYLNRKKSEILIEQVGDYHYSQLLLDCWIDNGSEVEQPDDIEVILESIRDIHQFLDDNRISTMSNRKLSVACLERLNSTERLSKKEEYIRKSFQGSNRILTVELFEIKKKFEENKIIYEDVISTQNSHLESVQTKLKDAQNMLDSVLKQKKEKSDEPVLPLKRSKRRLRSIREINTAPKNISSVKEEHIKNRIRSYLKLGDKLSDSIISLGTRISVLQEKLIKMTQAIKTTGKASSCVHHKETQLSMKMEAMQEKFDKLIKDYETKLKNVKTRIVNEIRPCLEESSSLKTKIVEYHEILMFISETVDLSFHNVGRNEIENKMKSLKADSKVLKAIKKLLSINQNDDKHEMLSSKMQFLLQMETIIMNHMAIDLTLPDIKKIENIKYNLKQTTDQATQSESFFGPIDGERYAKAKQIVDVIESRYKKKVEILSDIELNNPAFVFLTVPSITRIIEFIENVETSECNNSRNDLDIIEKIKNYFDYQSENISRKHDNLVSDYNELFSKFLKLNKESEEEEKSDLKHRSHSVAKVNNPKANLRNIEKKMENVNKVLRSMELEGNDKLLKEKFLEKLQKFKENTETIDEVIKKLEAVIKNTLNKQRSTLDENCFRISLDAIKKQPSLRSFAVEKKNKKANRFYSEHNKQVQKRFGFTTSFTKPKNLKDSGVYKDIFDKAINTRISEESLDIK